MAERGAEPRVPRGRRLFLRAVRRLFSPLQPDDYLEMINPLWTTKELRGKVEGIEAQGSEAASVLIRPGYEWPGHKPGQYVRLGVVIDGVYHWRAYSSGRSVRSTVSAPPFPNVSYRRLIPLCSAATNIR